MGYRNKTNDTIFTLRGEQRMVMKKKNSAWDDIRDAFTFRCPVIPYFRWGNNSFVPITVIELKGKEIILTMPAKIDVQLHHILNVCRPLGSMRNHYNHMNRLLYVTGKVQVVKIFSEFRVQVVLVAGSVVDALCVEREGRMP